MANAVEVRGIEELQRRMAAWPRAITRAARRAVDRTATRVRKELIAEIVEETTAKKGPVGKQIKVIQRSRPDLIEAKIGITRTPILLRDFKTKTSRRKTAVAADISTEPGKGVVVVRKAFKPTGRPKKEIYERIRRGGRRVPRYPIRLATGPSAATMTGPIMPTIIRKGEDFLVAEFGEQLRKEQRRIDARQ